MEERNRKLIDQGARKIFDNFSGDFESIQREFEEPSKHQQQEDFENCFKFAAIITNDKYDKVNSKNKAVKDLPAVRDDHRNIK